MNKAIHTDMDKEKIRREMRTARRALSAQEQSRAAQAVFARLCAFEPYQRAKSVMAYAAVRGELSLAPVMEHVLSGGRTLLLPRCEAPGVMTARRIERLSQMEPGAYGLPEPRADCEIAAPDAIDLILVPGTAFDLAGGRIGQGGGYYDRFLAKTGALRVGVCHDFARLKHVCMQAHDARMDALATPEGIWTI